MKCNLEEKSRIGAGVKADLYKDTYDEADVGVFSAAGLGFSDVAKNEIIRNASSYGFDAAEMATVPSVGTPVQLLQWWSPKVIKTIYAGRKADEIMGVVNAGSWEDEEVVVPEVETLGDVALYGDYANGENSNFNVNFNKRSVVRFLSTVSVGTLEAAQVARMRLDAKEKKMVATTNALEIQRNLVAFNGFNYGNKANYGLLNDPRLPAYGTLSVGASGSTMFKDKTYIEIVNDIRGLVRELELKLNGNFDASTDAFKLILPMAASQSMTAVPQYGANGFAGSVEAWFKGAYPKGEIHYVPQFDGALGGQNVVYVIAEEVDGEKNVDQFVQQRMFLVGFERRDTYFKETYSNATAGAFVGYGIGVVRKVGA